MRFRLVESLNQLPKEIIDLNNKMNKAEYDAKDFEHYRTIPVDEWDLDNAGCCWDFVSYEAEQFDNMKYNYETYFVQIDNNNDCPTHTFLIFEYNNKWYWFESSWQKYQGIKEFDTKEDAISHVCSLLFNEYDKDNEFEHYIFKYDTELVKDGNMDSLEYMNTIYDNGKEISLQGITE